MHGEDELRRIMAEPLEKWRVFLHPTQRKIVQKEYSGSAKVLGGAGTGKTVVAMHRAKHLASKCEVDDRSFDGLRVATMHRVKGLEFKYVFIAAVNNRIIPMPSAINKTDVVSEAESITSEKCLLYVAMTRAQKGVYITSYGRPSEFLG